MIIEAIVGLGVIVLLAALPLGLLAYTLFGDNS